MITDKDLLELQRLTTEMLINSNAFKKVSTILESKKCNKVVEKFLKQRKKL